MTSRLLLAWLRSVATVMRVSTRYPSVRPRNWGGRGGAGGRAGGERDDRRLEGRR